MKRTIGWIAGLLIGGAAVLGAQTRAQAPLDAPDTDLAPAEIQRLFDAYAIVQAQEMLRLNDVQYGQFVSRLKGLQEVRRQNQRERTEMMQGLARLANQQPPADEALIRERLKALEDHDARAATSLRKAYEAIDQMLSIVQQARFRVFEEQMERRKLQLLLRARAAQRPERPRRVPPR